MKRSIEKDGELRKAQPCTGLGVSDEKPGMKGARCGELNSDVIVRFRVHVIIDVALLRCPGVASIDLPALRVRLSGSMYFCIARITCG